MLIKRHCIVCEKQLLSACCSPSADPDKYKSGLMEISDPPNDGICATSYGNWGSTVLDSGYPGGYYIEFNVCDKCLKDKARKGFIHKITKRDKPQLNKDCKVEVWNG